MCFAQGFTLLELLAVVGIISVLISLVVPTVGAARSSARQIACASNLRQISQGLLIYASQNRGLLPMNVSVPKAMYWYDSDRLGRMLTPTQPALLGGIAACPEDNGGLRSYSMNFWASSGIDTSTLNNDYGTPWRLNVSRAERYILAAEKWSASGSWAAGWVATLTIGSTKNPPGRRFGGGIGITPILSSGHFGQANSELPFQRHRLKNAAGQGSQPLGRVNIAYADGHVSIKSHSDLVDSTTGLSTLDSWWSPKDAELNK